MRSTLLVSWRSMHARYAPASGDAQRSCESTVSMLSRLVAWAAAAQPQSAVPCAHSAGASTTYLPWRMPTVGGVNHVPYALLYLFR